MSYYALRELRIPELAVPGKRFSNLRVDWIGGVRRQAASDGRPAFEILVVLSQLRANLEAGIFAPASLAGPGQVLRWVSVDVGVISFFVLFVALGPKKSHNINRLGIAQFLGFDVFRAICGAWG